MLPPSSDLRTVMLTRAEAESGLEKKSPAVVCSRPALHTGSTSTGWGARGVHVSPACAHVRVCVGGVPCGAELRTGRARIAGCAGRLRPYEKRTAVVAPGRQPAVAGLAGALLVAEGCEHAAIS